jgi:hypothetical protein
VNDPVKVMKLVLGVTIAGVTVRSMPLIVRVVAQPVTNEPA